MEEDAAAAGRMELRLAACAVAAPSDRRIEDGHSVRSVARQFVHWLVGTVGNRLEFACINWKRQMPCHSIWYNRYQRD